MSLKAGDRLGRYEILSFLGAGAMGEVFRGRDSQLRREVAIKLLASSLAADPELLLRFEQEARAAGSLNHPNLLVVYDAGSHEGRPFLVSELLEGESLSKRLASGALPPRKAVEYATQIARGLAAAHAKGIVHRDLKPDNLFVTREGQVKILDFGLAKLTQQPLPNPDDKTQLMPTTAGTVLGTPGYMAPEQVRGEAVDHRADLFSFGAVFYEMLCGRRAFTGRSPADVMTAVLREEPPEIGELTGKVPPTLEGILRRCLEKDAGARAQSAHDLAFHLEVLAAPSAASGALPALALPASPWFGARRPVPLALAAGLAAAGLLVGLLAGRRWRSDDRPPTYQRLTFRRGMLDAARFAPNDAIVFSAAWEGQPRALFFQPAAAADAMQLSLPAASVLAVSRDGELAIALDCRATHNGTCRGTLATAPMSGGAPRKLREKVQQADWSPDGKTLALVTDDGIKARLELTARDGSGGRLLYETSGHLSFPRISPGGDRIAFFDHPNRIDDGGSLAVVDLATGRKTTLVKDLAGGAQGLAWAPGGREVWFTAARGGTDRALYAVDLSGRDRSVAAVPGSLTLQDIAGDGRVLVNTDASRFSIQVRPPGEAGERELSWLGWSFLGDMSDDGSTILFDEEAADPNFVVCLRPTNGSAVVGLGPGRALALSPDGQWALSEPVTGANLVLLPTGAGSSQAIPSHGLQLSARSAAWFPGGARIAFVAKQPGHGIRVWVQDLTGGAPRAVTPEGFGFRQSRPISPDGRYLVAGSRDRGSMIFPVAGGPPRPVPGLGPAEKPLLLVRWSADGHQLFVRSGEMPLRIFLLDLDSGRRQPWKEISAPDLAGAAATLWLSADGNSYAYNVQRNLSDLFLVKGLR
jgi:Tol biopolymer transport system component